MDRLIMFALIKELVNATYRLGQFNRHLNFCVEFQNSRWRKR